MSNIVLSCNHVGKSYRDGELSVDVLQNLDFQVAEGQSVSIIGASGSGKSTLLHILGGLDMPSSGHVNLMGNDLSKMSQKQLGDLRNRYLGFVYQFHHLLPEFSALENVMMPLLIGKKPKAEAEATAAAMLEKVGLKARMLHRPSELSGGERQRAAIARALVTQPKCLLADEPTGNLDRKNAQNILDMMLELKNELGTALVVVTHDDELAVRFDRVMTMADGQLRDKVAPADEIRG
ncbi:MAG: lipoprotein-releasing ABC transporter ATP-binding protein LolD [Neisseria sp.]|nr:lipoprotein-releasing ABC transporter ATP-binding protein LolD [Neisseria sp.]